MLRNGVMPIPPVRNTAARVKSFWRIKSPDGPSIFTAVPNGIVATENTEYIYELNCMPSANDSLGLFFRGHDDRMHLCLRVESPMEYLSVDLGKLKP
jgi:hypothetical protein